MHTLGAVPGDVSWHKMKHPAADCVQRERSFTLVVGSKGTQSPVKRLKVVAAAISYTFDLSQTSSLSGDTIPCLFVLLHRL